MIKKLTLNGKWTFLIVAVFLVIGMTSCGEAPKQGANTGGTPKPTCDAAMERSIEDALRATLEKDATIVRQMKHINFFAKGCVVVLQGWADDQASYDAVKKYATDTPNVTSVDVNKFKVGPDGISKPDPGTGQCQPGFKVCGELCIPEGDRCNIKPS